MTTEVEVAKAEEVVPPTSSNGAEQNSASSSQDQAEPKDMGQLKKDIVRQVEHYFGDYNLMRDSFLKKAMAEPGKDGWISMDIMVRFYRLARLSTDHDLILGAIKELGSELVEVDEAAKSMRRLPSLPPVPEFNEDIKKELIQKTVYVKGFNKENTSLDDLIEYFNRFENVVHVNRRTYVDKKDDSRHFKGSTFVNFKDVESAQKFLDLESVKAEGSDAELIRMWQADYFKMKEKENEERVKSKQERRNKTKKAQQAAAGTGDEAKQEANEAEGMEDLPTGTVLILENITDATTHRENIKEQLQKEFDVDPKSIAFIFFQAGDTSAKLRFCEQDAAKNLAEKMKAKFSDDKHFCVKESKELTFSVMEGEEEKAFLEQCKKDIQGRKGQPKKRKFNNSGRGRGGKRQRQW